MEILSTNQYNQGIGKSKLLSSTAGVGAIITTTIGYYILISDINKWKFVEKSQAIADRIRKNVADDSERYKQAKQEIQNKGITVIDDLRFIQFLKIEKNLPELMCLISIPNIALNEHFNTPSWKNHPIAKLLESQGENPRGKAEEFMVLGTHFPKWFKNDEGSLKTYSDWKQLWKDKKLGVDRFVPPRDANKPIKDSKGNHKFIKLKNEDNSESTIFLYTRLSQTNLILICPNGHLSDVPWSQFLKWKSEKRGKDDNGDHLFIMDSCCPNPDLMWTESKTKSEGYGSIFIECNNCHKKENLEGINNLKPICPGHKPWEMKLSQDVASAITYEPCHKNGESKNDKEKMDVALVTGNNVYYANGFSSLYIPKHLADNKSPEMDFALEKCEEKYKRYLEFKPNITNNDFWEKLDKEDFLIENRIKVDDVEAFLLMLKNDFLAPKEIDQIDIYEEYRWKEYNCFINNNVTPNGLVGLKFNDIKLSEELSQFFERIKQVEELKVTQVQLGFTRKQPRERIRVENEIKISAKGQDIYSIEDNEVYVLPANETYGEGLFFQFDDKKINEWIDNNIENLQNRYKRYLSAPDLNTQGASFKQRIYNNCFKQFLIHTFSHVLMRELEFSCGYPTASLKERLYISDRMSGVLIYTAEGSEGSMGGLVWQGQPEKLKTLIMKGLERAMECSSDPLCWESEGQGIFDLNLAACFSCSLTSETACEEMNLGLDRRALIDVDLGFFKSLFV